MAILVTGSAGHLGEGLMRTFRDRGVAALGLDIKPSDFTDAVGSIADRPLVKDVMGEATAVIHAATLHKPHVETHTHQDFVDANITGTLALLEAAQGRPFVFTSTTSAFGSALTPPPGEPAAWITEDVTPVPKNIYGATKVGAEVLCEMFARKHRQPLIILRTSRFFPEEDDDAAAREQFSTDNMQANELLHRRADLADVVDAHLLALDQAATLGFGRYIVSATSPFEPGDLAQLRTDAPAAVRRRFPAFEALYAAAGWRMAASIDRVYVNRRAREALGWRPRYDFAHVLRCLEEGVPIRSPLAQAVGSKGYHAKGAYPFL